MGVEVYYMDSNRKIKNNGLVRWVLKASELEVKTEPRL